MEDFFQSPTNGVVQVINPDLKLIPVIEGETLSSGKPIYDGGDLEVLTENKSVANFSNKEITLDTGDENHDSEDENLKKNKKKREECVQESEVISNNIENILNSKSLSSLKNNLSSDSEDEQIGFKRPFLNKSKHSEGLSNQKLTDEFYSINNDDNSFNTSSSARKKFFFHDSSSEDETFKSCKTLPNRKYSERSRIKKEKKSNLLTKIREKKSMKSNNVNSNELTGSFDETETVINNALDNKDIYTQDNSSDDNKSSEDSDHEELLKDRKSDTKKEKRKTKAKVKRICKSDIQEIKSEQQRMCREQTFKIPSHVPAVRPIQDFLKRVPKLKSYGQVNEKINMESPNSQILKKKPKIEVSTGSIEFDLDAEHKKVTGHKKTVSLDSFLEKVAMKASNQKKVISVASQAVPYENKNTQFTITNSKSSKVPGESRLILKKQLKEKIRNERYQNHLEVKKQLEISNEDSEEEYIDEGVSSNESEDEEKDNKIASSDEEIEKWNVEDERKQIEDVMNDLDKKKIKEDQEKFDNNLTPCKEDFSRWDDSSSTLSSILPAGQGEPTDPKVITHLDGRITPSTKLLKSGLLDSASRTSCNSEAMKENEATFLNLPCEDTQDLYKTSEPIIMKEDLQRRPFSFSLDEDSQFDQILDSQGFLQSNKVEKMRGKKLFEKEFSPEPYEMSMSQVLGLCSGKFQSNETSTHISETFKSPCNYNGPSYNLSMNKNNGTDAYSLCSSIIVVASDAETSDASSMFKPINDNSKESSLLSLCSDNSSFHTTSDIKKESATALFDNNLQSQNAGLIELCSGKFVTSEQSDVDGSDNAVDFSVELSKSQEDFLKADDSGQNNVDSSEEYEFHDKTNEEDVDESEDNSVVNDNEEEYNDSENEEAIEWKESQTNGKKRLNKKAFYEHEAELSGSDVGSDDEDLGSEYDEYEEDSIDEDLPTEEKLKRQVHRIHQRKVLDEDKRELRLLQELYLEDGDLGGGAKRKRNFRWQNIDNTGFEDQSSHIYSDGEEEFPMDADVDKKIVRLQKEKFLQELQQSENAHLDENSQSILNMIKDSSYFTPPVLSQSRILERISSQPQSKSVSKKASGSFLARSSDLSRLSHVVAGKKTKSTTKSFVYMTEECKESAQDVIMKDSLNHKVIPPAKRIKVDRCLDVKKNSNSIFSHF